ncbi:hypothetical protein LT875_002468 [Salmonella enterica]|nr:hypothetical protein [Salmonella enterica]
MAFHIVRSNDDGRGNYDWGDTLTLTIEGGDLTQLSNIRWYFWNRNTEARTVIGNGLSLDVTVSKLSPVYGTVIAMEPCLISVEFDYAGFVGGAGEVLFAFKQSKTVNP